MVDNDETLIGIDETLTGIEHELENLNLLLGHFIRLQISEGGKDTSRSVIAINAIRAADEIEAGINLARE